MTSSDGWSEGVGVEGIVDGRENGAPYLSTTSSMICHFGVQRLQRRLFQTISLPRMVLALLYGRPFEPFPRNP